MTTFEIALSGPLDIPASLEPLRRWDDDFLDRWDGTYLVRTVSIAGSVCAPHDGVGTGCRVLSGRSAVAANSASESERALAVSLDDHPRNYRTVPFSCVSTGTIQEPTLQVTIDNPSAREAVEAELLTMFLLPPPDYADLLQRDPAVAQLDARFPGIRPIRYLDLLASLVRAISAQQVNLKWAAETRRRLALACGQKHEIAGHTVYSLPAERLAAVDPAEIRALQFTTRKAEYIVGCAQAVSSGYLDPESLAQFTDDEVIAKLVALRGIGLWTAEWMLVRFLGRPRVVAGDLGVRKAVGQLYGIGNLPLEANVREATAHWGASAAVAQALILEAWVQASREP